MEGKTVDESRVETVRIVRPNHLNGANRLFGGILMQWIDEVAGIVAKRHASHNVTTAAVDSLEFTAPAYANDTLVLVGTVTYTGRTSMEICVKTYIERLGGQRKLVNKAYVIMVALDENEQPTEVPGLICETEEEEREYLEGIEYKPLPFFKDFWQTLKSKDNLAHTLAFLTLDFLIALPIGISASSNIWIFLVGMLIQLLVEGTVFILINTFIWSLAHRRWSDYWRYAGYVTDRFEK